MKLPLDLLLTIGGVPIFQGWDGEYIAFISDLDICNDGTGDDYDDPSFQSMTAYNPYLSAESDRYIVTPPQIRTQIEPVVLGCQGRVTNLLTRAWSWGVVGEVGPDYETGECSYCLAKLLNSTITHNSGDDRLIYLYEFWPGVPAVVGDQEYNLQPT
jgi:hypothetical protein